MTVSGHFYPLDPLSEAEIRVVVGVLKRDRRMDSRWRFASIELKEPDKERLKSHDAGEEIPREADLVVWNREDGQAYKARVSLTEGTVIGWEPRPGEQPNITVDEFHEADEMLRQHPDAIEALKKRGITDLNKVLFDVWAYGGSLVAERHRGRRVGWVDVWVRDHEDSNPYAKPVNGLHFVVDLNSVELLEVEDDYAVERPDVMGEYLPKYVPDQKLRNDLKPLEIAQPEGVSFTLEGNLLEWQKWSLRVGFNYREGLVLHTVGYRDERDGGRTRSIAHRMSFAEMIVPYRDPSPDHYRRTAFDIGEWGLGYMTSSLELGCDCLGEIRYLDAVLSDSKGEPYTIKNAVCIHEEDDALLWKHVDEVAGSEVRRSRRLVISFHATVANYEYIVYWRFYQDGNIECEVRATGIMVTTSFEGERPPYGTLVDRRTYAPHHQHFLVARLDLDVDGETNTVYMTESEATPVSDENPHGLGLVQKSTPLKTESEGRQDYNWNTQRAWKVVNDGKKNRLGTSVGYKLVPGACFPAMMDKSSPVFKRAGVVGHNLWVTPYSEDERWPCGEFVNQSEVDSGLTKWTERNRNIEEADVVLWYVFGIHHITRPEDWPVMPVDTVSFWMKPVGFFDRNPALDVPPASKGHCHSSDPS